MYSLPEPTDPVFEARAADCIRRQLEAHGLSPWSICEARLGEDDYQRLCRWAKAVPGTRLVADSAAVGLVLLAFVAEWNRRNSPGYTVWVGLSLLFGDESARRRLFTGNNQPTAFMYRMLQRTSDRFQLRHAFAAEQEEDLRYYLSIQLQYGFSLPHARNQLSNWLRGHRPPEVALRLLEPDGYYRSTSFRRLVRDMKSYRRNYLPESDFRSTLRDNPWVLPAWEDELVTLIDGIPRDADEDEQEFRLLSDPRVAWEDGPEVLCRVCALPDRLAAPRYLLRHAGRDVARYYRSHTGEVEADRTVVRLPSDGPELVVTLETPDGEVVEVQSVRLWDPACVVQVRPVGREAEEAVESLLPGEQVLISSTEAVVTPAPTAWRVVGPRDRQRRWWLLDGTERVLVEDGGVEWTGEPPPPPPAWTSRVSVILDTVGSFFRLGERVQFRIDAPAGVDVGHANCAGQPLSFSDAARTRTSPMPVREEMSGRCTVRVGVVRGRESAVVRKEVLLPVRSVVWADDGGAIPEREPLACYEAMSRPVRLLSDGPVVLVEGREIVGPLPVGRAARIRRVLGTGQELAVVDSPFNTQGRFRLTRSAVDTGLARSLEQEGGRWRLTLFRQLPPSERHRVVIWSPNHGVELLDASQISVEDGGRVWSLSTSWETDTLLAAIVYDGRCLASACSGQERRFFDPGATDGLDLIGRVALIRWCRLPGLRPDPDATQAPLIARLAQFPVEMLRVALSDEGLPPSLGLEFEARTSPRGELFNVIVREAYVQPTLGNPAAVFDSLPLDNFRRLIEVFSRQMTYHPLLCGRAIQAVLPRQSAASKSDTRVFLWAIRFRILSLGENAVQPVIALREAELLDRACGTFSENGRPMDEYAVRQGLLNPVMKHMFDGSPLVQPHEDNLRTALGVASFREYLAAAILRRLLDQPA